MMIGKSTHHGNKPQKNRNNAGNAKEYFDHQTQDFMTALHYFSKSGAHQEEVKSMLESHSHLVCHPTAKGGDTPLHFAVAAHDILTTRMLLRANPSAAEIRSSYDGNFGSNVTPLHVAMYTQASPELIKALVEAAPRALKMRDGDGKTPQELAFHTYCGETLEKVLTCLSDEKARRSSSCPLLIRVIFRRPTM